MTKDIGQDQPGPKRQGVVAFALVAATVFLTQACLFSDEKTCGPNQELGEDNLCHCVPGTSPTRTGTCEGTPSGTPAATATGCTSDAECTSGNATFCAAFIGQCLVPDCTITPDSCAAGTICCNLAKLGLARNLCLPTSGCP